MNLYEFISKIGWLCKGKRLKILKINGKIKISKNLKTKRRRGEKNKRRKRMVGKKRKIIDGGIKEI